MEVDDAACLVFGDLDVPDAQGSTEGFEADAREAGELAGQVGTEPAPQVPRAGVEQHGRVVVVAVGAHGTAEPGVVFDVPGRAGDIMAMRAAASPGVAAGTAGQDGLAAHAPGVDRPEARGSQGREHTRMRGDGLGYTLAARQTGADELPRVALIDRRASRADGLAAVTAGHMQHSPGLAGRVVDGGDLTRGPVDGLDVAEQADGVRAGAGGGHLPFPGLEVAPGDGFGGVVGKRPHSRAGWFGGESGCRGRVGHWLPQRCWAACRVMPSRVPMSAQE